MMSLASTLLLLPTLSLSSPLPSSLSISALPTGCRDFTVGACSPEEDELIDTYDNIPEPSLCQTLCELQEGCNYFHHSTNISVCSLFHYRFLKSCQFIAGPSEPGIDVCAEETAPSCDSFVRKDCK